MPTPLTPALVDDSLGALSDWTGDTSSISRTVRLDSPDEVVSLIEAVAVSGESLGHRPVVERDGTAVTFTLPPTPDAAVTEVDIALASHIDNLAGRLAGAAPTPAPSSARGDDVYQGPGRNHAPSLTVDHEGQSARAGALGRRRLKGGKPGPTIGVPTVSQGSMPTPGVAVPDEQPHHPQPGVEPEQRPRTGRRRAP